MRSFYNIKQLGLMSISLPPNDEDNYNDDYSSKTKKRNYN